ncbi:MAG: MFS transporter [Byssovorax sp.]
MRSSAPARRPLPRAVIALGWVSLLTDAASDMIYPLVPAFLITLGGGAEALGWIEGVAEAVAAVVKIIAGRLADRAPRKKPLIAAGYGLSALARPLFAVATSPIHAVFVRALDRVGKGLRGPPRDLVLAAAVGAESRGAAFGFHRMMDNFGGVLGPLIAFTLLRAFDLPLRTVFAASVVPGLFAVVVILVFVREPPTRALLDVKIAPAPGSTGKSPALAPLPPSARRYLAVVGLFSLAGSGDLFLLNRMTDLGMDRALVPIAWVSLQLGKGLLNVAGGRASDRFGRRPVLVIAWVLYAVSYVGFGLVGSWPMAWGLLAIYAFHYGFAEGGQRALLAELVPSAARGRAFGLQTAIEGLAVLPANVLFGLVYARVSARAAFVGSGAIALCAAALLLTVTAPPPEVDEPELKAEGSSTC